MQLVDAKQGVIASKFTFLDFKHNYNQRPFQLLLIARTIFVQYKSFWIICLLGGECQVPFFV